MKLLALDANSIVNRAFYGIRPLSTKEGMFTNGIYGFMNILLKIRNEQKPDVIAAAFDLKAPTFRHKMYSEYKAGRKPMPEELAMQIPVLKELLCAYGCVVIEKEGYEADDILGTLSHICEQNGDECVIATGDRDSLQLVGEHTTVLLAATKAGSPEVTVYNSEAIMRDYGVTPPEMIEIKALQGDSSDNIPGVAGVGPKTAGGLISKYHSIEYIYENIDSLDIKDNLRAKLIKDKDNAFLSKTLGTICKTAPIEISFANSEADKLINGQALTALLIKLEMFKIIDRLGLKAAAVNVNTEEAPKLEKTVQASVITDKTEIAAGSAVYYDKEQGALFACCDEGYFKYTENIPALLENAKDIVVYNAKELYHTFGAKKELSIANDVLIAAYIIEPDKNDYSLDLLSMQYSVNKRSFSEYNEQLGAVDLICRLSRAMLEIIEKNNQTALLKTVEIPLSYTLYTMEKQGFLVDKQGITEFADLLAEKQQQLESIIFGIIGYEFNLNSPKQLGVALFEKLGLPHGKKTKTGYSTSAEVLEQLKYESDAVEYLLEFRSVAKLKSTYCDGLLKVINGDGRIRSTLNQTETRTGRISSAEPNLQNIPVRTPLGAQMRKYFIAKEGCVLVDADYSQIELRVLAQIADDENMKNAFAQGTDIHTVTASQVFNMPVDMVTPQMRSSAKAVNFGIVYGIGAFSLSKDIGVSVAQARKYIESYLATYSGVDKYMKDVVEKAKENGYVSTLMGRRRYLPELASGNFNTRSFGERVARNMPIQGTSADIIKIAMNRVCRRLEDEGYKAKLIMQVHDELICEAPENEAGDVARILKEEMENAVDFSVKLTAEVNIGKSWYDAK